MDRQTDHAPDAFADQVDRALEALWHGQSNQLTRLLGDDASSSGLQEIYQTFRTCAAAPPPERIGEYQIVREIGRGGMGIVYEARQQHPQRTVALKVVRRAARLDDLHVRLFEREIRTLARLQHPGIASVYSAGCTSDAQQYFAMEFVHGKTLAGFIKDADRAGTPISLSARLNLFCRICDAIHHAHQRGVIHRDLKPSNVLVTGEPAPRRSSADGVPSALEPGIKILDFGLAHLADVENEASTLVTEPGRIIGTLAYMSPEQARGDADAVDLRTDVYALGIMLYELLTGRLPYDIARLNPQRALDVICNAEPPRPSTLNRVLDRDIDTIVLKAIEKDPVRRYPSASALAEDVRRFVAGQPILARPPSATYQIRKLVGRHKAPATLAILLLLAIIVFGIVSGVQAARIARQRDKAIHAEQREVQARARAERSRAAAERETAKAREIQAFLEDLLASVEPARTRGRDAGLLRDLLTEAAHRVDAELTDQPEVAAAVRTTIGRTYCGLALYAEAEPHLQAVLAYAEATYGPDDQQIIRPLLNLGELHTRRGAYQTAETLLRRACALCATHAVDGALRVQSLHQLSFLLGFVHEYDEAEALLREALAINEAMPAADDRLLADSTERLASLLNRRENLAEAVPAYQRAVALCRSAFGPSHPKTAMAVNNLATALKKKGEYAEADTLYRESIGIQRLIYSDGHPDLADGLTAWAELLKLMGRYAEAETLLGEAIAIQRKHLGEDSDQYAAAVAHLASVRIRQGDLAAAETGYREALAIYRRIHGDDHLTVLVCKNAVATILIKQQRYAEAEGMLREIRVLFAQLYGADHPRLTVFDSNIAMALTALGRLDEAEQLYRGVLATRRTLHGTSHPDIAKTLCKLAGVLEKQNAPIEAEALYLEGLAMLRATEGDNHPEVGAGLISLAALWEADDRVNQAAAALAEAYTIHAEAYPPDHPERAATEQRLAEFLRDHPGVIDPALADSVPALPSTP